MYIKQQNALKTKKQRKSEVFVYMREDKDGLKKGALEKNKLKTECIKGLLLRC